MEKQVRLSGSLSIPRLVIGMWQIADMERRQGVLDPVKTASFMEPYARAGFTAFDMADHYGSSEIIAGTFKNSYDDPTSIKLFTKWVPEPGKISKDQVRKAIETALQRMQQPTLDLMQFHAWHYPDPSWLDALFYLDELREEGLEGWVLVPIGFILSQEIAHIFDPDESMSGLSLQVIAREPGIGN